MTGVPACWSSYRSRICCSVNIDFPIDCADFAVPMCFREAVQLSGSRTQTVAVLPKAAIPGETSLVLLCAAAYCVH